MRRWGSWVMVAVLLSACAEGVTTAARKTGPASGQTNEAKTTVLKPGAKASGEPGANGAATPAPLASHPAPVATSAVPSRLISGSVLIDANYAVVAGGAKIIAAGGGNVIAAGGGNVIAAGGGNVIAAGGGNVIAAGGGNVIAVGGGNYRLLEGISVPVGTMLPVKGMLVVPVSLATNRQIGEAVLTDDQGRYQLSVPESETGTFRVYAALPGKSADDPILKDPRLSYDLLTSASRKTEDNVLDEDVALVARFMRLSFVERFLDFMTRDEDSLAADPSYAALTQNNPAMFKMFMGDLFSAFREAKTKEFPLAKRRALSQRLADLLLSKVDVFSATVDTSRGNPGNDTLVLPALLDILHRTGAASAARLSENPQYFKDKAYILEGSQRAAAQGRPAYEIKRPSDVGAFMVQEYMTVNDSNRFRQVAGVFEDLGLAEPKVQMERLDRAAYGSLKQIIQTLMLNADAKQELRNQIIEAGKTP